MAYQTYLNNRTHKLTMPNAFLPSLSTTTTEKFSTSSISLSPNDMGSSLTSSDSGTTDSSTFSFPTPIGFGSDSQLFDLPTTTTFGDLGGFNSYHECSFERRNNHNNTGEKPLNFNGQDIHLSSDKPINSPVPTTRNYNCVHSADIGAGESNAGIMPIPSPFASSTCSTASTLPAPAALKTFQFSFRMAPPNTNNIQTREQVRQDGGGGRRKAHSFVRNSQASALTNAPSNHAISKPLTLQFSTRNGQPVLSLSTSAREAAVLREKMKKERCSSTVTNEVDSSDRRGKNAPMGSKGKEKCEAHTKEESCIWRNIKPAPAPISHGTNSYLSLPTVASRQISNLEQTMVHTQSQSLQEYHDAYVPYDMYEEMIHDSFGSQVIAQSQHQVATVPVGLGRTCSGQSESQMPSSPQDLHSTQASQLRLRNRHPALSSPTCTYVCTSPFTASPDPNKDVSSSVLISSPSPTNSRPPVQSGSGIQIGKNQPPIRALEQQGQSLSRNSPNQYSTSHAKVMCEGGNATSHIHFQQGTSGSIPVQPPTVFRRPNGACTRCKRMKMKCTFPPMPSGAAQGLYTIPEAEVEFSLIPSPHPLPHSLACVRCAAADHSCIVEGRKPRTPSQREALLASLRQKDAIIATLLTPFQPSEQNANIVLNGAKVIEAIDKRKENAINSLEDNGLCSVSDDALGSTIGPVERAALLANDKGVSAKERHFGLGLGKTKHRDLAVSDQNASTNSSDEGSLSSESSDFNDSDDDEMCDNNVKVNILNNLSHSRTISSVTPQPQTISRHRASTHQLKMYLHALPPLNTPLGIIARLSLEGMGEKLQGKTKRKNGTGDQEHKVKIERVSESIPSLTGQKRRRDIGDAGDEEREIVEEDEDMYDLVAASGPVEPDDSAKDSDEETVGRNSVVSSLTDAQSITLSDAQTLSLSSLIITELDGPSHRAYFAPGLVSNLPLRRIINSRAPAPPILGSGLVTWGECETLFEIYYEYVHPYCSVLDPVLHTVQAVYERDPFLFTVILAVSSRYYVARPGLYKVAMHYAKAAAATAFVNGIKSVEMVQAYLIMCTYSLPARRWEEDRSWFYGGLAFRIATDLNLDKSFDDFKFNMKMASLTGSATNLLSERQEREKLNRMRTWLNCFNVDRSSSTQWGKPATLIEGEPIRKAREWWRCSLYNHPYDLHLVAYTELLRIVSRFHEKVYSDPMSKTGLNKNANFQKITEEIEVDIKDWHDNTRWHYDSSTTKPMSSSSFRSPVASSPAILHSPNSTSEPLPSRRSPPTGNLKSDPALIVRIEGVPVFENYMRLVMYSFGFEQAWRKWKARRSKSNKADMSKNTMLTMDMGLDLDGGDMFFVKCLHAASSVVRHLSDVYGPSGYLKYAPDCFFVMGGFCGAFLLKMLRPAFAPLLDSMQRERILQVVTRFVDTLDSATSSIDATHTPRLYAKFLKGVMRDVTGSNDSGVGQAVDFTHISTTEPLVQMQMPVSSISADLTATASSTTKSPSGPPILSSFHSQMPSISEGINSVNSGINSALIVFDSFRDQGESGNNSETSTPKASSMPTPTPLNALFSSNPDFDPAGHSLGIQSRWAQLLNPELILRESGSMSPNPAQAPQPYFEHQTRSQDMTRSTFNVDFGAAVMASQSQGEGLMRLDDLYSHQLCVSHEPGSGFWVNQHFVPHGTFQQVIAMSDRPLPSLALTTNAEDLKENEMLATMRAVSSDNWNNSVIMPGYGWGPDEDVGMTDA